MKTVDLERSDYAVTTVVDGVETTEEAIPEPSYLGKVILAAVMWAVLMGGLIQPHPAPAEIGSQLWWAQNR